MYGRYGGIKKLREALVGKPEEREHLEELDLVNGTDLKEIGWEDLRWIDLAQERGKWETRLLTVGSIKYGKVLDLLRNS
jgi:hypothetical protein